MAPEIISIRCVTSKGFGTHYIVGTKAPDGRIIDLICDNSMTWEDHIDYVYTVYDGLGKRIAELINVPVQIEYKDIYK